MPFVAKDEGEDLGPGPSLLGTGQAWEERSTGMCFGEEQGYDLRLENGWWWRSWKRVWRECEARNHAALLRGECHSTSTCQQGEESYRVDAEVPALVGFGRIDDDLLERDL